MTEFNSQIFRSFDKEVFVMERKVEGIIKEQYVVRLNNRSVYRGAYFEEDDWYLKGYGDTELEAIQNALNSTYNGHSLLELSLETIYITIEDVLFIEDNIFAIKEKKYVPLEERKYSLSDIENMIEISPLYKMKKREEEERITKLKEEEAKKDKEKRLHQYMILKNEFDTEGR